MSDNLPASNQQRSAIQSSPTSLSVPECVHLDELDAEQFFMPTVQRHHERALRQSAVNHRNALAPASEREREYILGELRLRTIPRTEGTEEARARHRCLMDDLSDAPPDILRDACNAYVNEPGSRWYPTAGELREFINPLMRRRGNRAHRLEMMADEASGQFDESTRCTSEQAAEILAEFGIKQPEQERSRKLPTVEDYMEIGLSRADAEKTLARQKSEFSRDKTIGSVAA